MNTIELFLLDGVWMSRNSDPEVLELFGTDLIPTPFKSGCPAHEVLAEIRERNPDCVVSLVCG